MASFSPVWRVELRLQPSRFFLLTLGALHLGAIAAVLASGLGASLRLALCLAVVLLLMRCWREELARAGVVVRERVDGWWLEAGGVAGVAELRRVGVWRFLVIMDFVGRSDTGRTWRRRVTVLPDTVPAASFRRLRVRLQHGRRSLPAEQSPDA